MRTHFICLPLVIVLLCPRATAQWVQTNGPYGGELLRVACDSSGVLYATHDGRGVFRSTDNGIRWYSASEGITRLRLNVIAANSTGMVFVASYLGGVFRSSDHGLRWHNCCPALPDSSTTMITVCHRAVYAGTTSYHSPVQGGRIFRSMDDGQTWSSISPTWIGQSVNAIAANGSGTIIAGVDSGMYRSTDDGVSWVRVRGPSDTTYASIVFDGHGRVYAAAARAVSFRGPVLRSTDDGATWQVLTGGLPDVRFGELLVDPSGALLAATLGSGIFRSSDHGDSWHQNNGGLTTRSVWGLGMNRAGDLFAATRDGVFSSSNGGDDWTRGGEGIDATTVTALAQNSAGRVFAGVGDGGVFCSDDNGTVWRQVNSGMPVDSFRNRRVNCVATGPTAGVLAATENGLFRSTNAGEFWGQLDLGFPSPRVSEVVVSPFGTIVASVVSAGLLRSTNDGLTWMQVGRPGISIYALAANSSGHIFAGFYDLAGGGITRSTDHGVNWSPLPLGVTYFTPDALTIDTHDNIVAASRERILRSTDNGATWIPTSMPSFNISVDALALDSSGRIYAGGRDYSAVTYATVQVSTDNGATWEAMNAGLAGDNVNALILDRPGFVLAGMSEYGVFRSTVSTSVGEYNSGSPGRFALFQNYPNPFNPTTTIEFRVQNSELTILKVFDLLGREIATLVNEVKEPGTYTVQWSAKGGSASGGDATGVSSGVYFYRLKVGDFVQTKRMMMLR